MVWLGELQATRSATPPLPFVMKMKRPDKMRFEVTVENEKSIRAFDGVAGWKVKPPRSGRPELKPFTPEEVRYAHDAPGIDGPLIDHEAKGIGVELEGTDEVEGHKAYRLKVRLPSGTTRRVWVDVSTFLDLKYERRTRGTDGQEGTVFVYYRDYRDTGSLQIPMTIETASADAMPGGGRHAATGN